ncbi:YceI family protein [Phaeodactylibacter luteus]|nr:YceI family protein [Phaeodactylibacter luteus]
MKWFKVRLLLWMISLSAPAALLSQRYLLNEGEAYFRSDAPLELIEARSKALRGVIDPEARAFAFSVPMSSFEGFNSPLQREHFNENYLESDVYPVATFSGRIIEEVDFSVPGDYVVRAKGKLNIHGIEQERIIKSELKVDGSGVHLKSDFTVLLEEHGISIPKIVYQKIAEEIAVRVEGTLAPQ